MPDVSQAEFKYLLERQREELKTITDVGRLLGSTADPQELVRLVASYLRHSFPIALFGIVLIEPKQLRLIQFAKTAQVDLNDAVRTICTTAGQRTAHPLTIEDLRQTLEDQSDAAGQWAQAPISYLRSNYSAALMFNNQPIGLLSVFSGKTDAFTTEDRHVIDIVADQLGAGLRNTFLLDELKRAGELKNQLLMVIAHELRIPLTSIKEGLSLLLEGVAGPTTATQQECLGVVHKSTLRLDRVVEKVVMTTQVLTGEIQYASAETDVAALLAELGPVLRPLAETKKIRLEVSVPGQSMRWLGDGPRMARALTNLVENAIQATPEGGTVTLSCAVTSAGLDVHVVDNGVGIPAEELPRIFDQFRIIGGVNDRKTGGLGLGLFLAKAIVEAHQGMIEIDSRVGEGTHVTVHLPVARTS